MDIQRDVKKRNIINAEIGNDNGETNLFTTRGTLYTIQYVNKTILIRLLGV
ncbi:hypothetical protein JOC95_002657 [Bacillus tianshenii]|uniref:Uncharacterized protein n=1 Tax=Sutcliffiella tianshenii TaxID=1463404 RepID=A0ABS2P1G7_9BACI|nr:hypothetical protein [Bacillus tianshenii]